MFLYSTPPQFNAILLPLGRRYHASAARFELKIRKYEHITEALKQLHWLPIAYRIKYKIALITFKTLNGQDPSYIR